MSGTLKHKTITGAPGNPAALVSGPEWDAEHNFAGGVHGNLLIRDTGQSDGAAWLPSSGVGGALLQDNGTDPPSYTVDINVNSVACGFLLSGLAVKSGANFGVGSVFGQFLDTDPMISLIGTQSQGLSDYTVLKIQQFDTEFTSYTIQVNSLSNADPNHKDHVLYFGYNVGSQGARLDAAEPMMALELHSRYQPVGDPQTTALWRYTDTSGNNLSMLRFAVDRAVPLTDPSSFTQVDLSGTSIRILDQNNTAVFLETLGQTSMLRLGSQSPVVNIQIFAPGAVSGGGAAVTLGNIGGGAGPSSPGQQGWFKFINANSEVCYVPLWK